MQTMRLGVGTPLQKAHNKKKCSNCGIKFDIINVELQNYIDGSIVWKKEDIAFCRNCNEFFFRSDYDTFVYKHPGYFDYKLAKHIKDKIDNEKKIKELEKNNLKTEQQELKVEPKESESKQTETEFGIGIEQTELELGLGSEQTKLDFDIADKEKSKEEKIEITKEEQKVEKKESTLPKVDFFVRSNVNSCSQKQHKIIDFIAEIDVIGSDGNIIKKSFNASYCEDCKLYFMYEKDYKRIRKSGVPLCSIYEYTKYIKINKNKGIELKPESLLHSFGYNVGVTEDLSANQRRKILSFVINKGIMSKHEIMNLLSYFVGLRKNDVRQSLAIAKWKSDINYLKNINVEADKKVEVNSIKVINIIKK